MNDSDLSNALRSAKRPDPQAEALKAQLRLALVSTRTSSRVGIVLVLVPALFLFGVVLHYGFGISVPGFGALENGLSWIEGHRFVSVLSPLILVGAPLIALMLNLLAVLHVQIDGPRREMHVTVKLRALNLTIAVLALAIIVLVFAHSIADR